MVTLKWSLVFDKIPSLLHGRAVTMEISVLTLIFGTILGVILAPMRDSHIKVIARLAQLYIWIWRGTPLMVQAFLISHPRKWQCNRKKANHVLFENCR